MMFNGILLGAVLGFISGLGFMSMNVKKSQRELTFPYLAVTTTIVGAAVGGRIGYRIKRDNDIERALGMDNVQLEHYKVGRYWESVSAWVDIEGDKYTIETRKIDNAVYSTFNGGNFIEHGTSASSVNITKYHNSYRQLVFEEIKTKYGEQYLHKLKDKRVDQNSV